MSHHPPPPELLRQWEAFERGELTAAQMAERLLAEGPSAGREGLCLDQDRARRCGFPEVVFGEGKSPLAVQAATTKLLELHPEVLITRSSEEHYQQLKGTQTWIRWDVDSRCLRVNRSQMPLAPDAVVPMPDSNSDSVCDSAEVLVVSAGTTDMQVAQEARETLAWMGISSQSVHDVGVAGPYRIFPHLDKLRRARAVIVVAGMEAALASVVGGHVSVPVIAVPTSVGYGANFGGLAALLGMINSCAANVTVVNIDAGFKAGYVAGLIANSHRSPLRH